MNAVLLALLLAAAPVAGDAAAPIDTKPSPVLLVPGFIGYRDMPVLGTYFVGLREALVAEGAEVFEVAAPPVASSEERAVYLLGAIEEVLRRTGAEKVSIIAHSQGGLDTRVALDLLDDELPGLAKDTIAVIVTLSTPHKGTWTADTALDKLPRPLVVGSLAYLQRVWQSEQHMRLTDADVVGSLKSLSRKHSKKFNRRHKGTHGIPFFSLAAVSGPDVENACEGGLWSAPRKMDAIHPIMQFPRMLLRAGAGSRVSDDGVVPTRSMRFGRFLGCVPGDHTDWMNWEPDRTDGDFGAIDANTFLVEVWRGMRDVELTGSEDAMLHRAKALAKLAHADDAF